MAKRSSISPIRGSGSGLIAGDSRTDAIAQDETTPELRWFGLFAMLLVALSLGAWGFGHSMTLGVTAEEMGYNPVHDVQGVSAHSRMVAGAASDTRFSIGCLSIAVLVSVLLFRSRAQRKTSFPPIVVGVLLVAALLGALLLGFMD